MSVSSFGRGCLCMPLLDAVAPSAVVRRPASGSFPFGRAGSLIRPRVPRFASSSSSCPSSVSSCSRPFPCSSVTTGYKYYADTASLSSTPQSSRLTSPGHRRYHHLASSSPFTGRHKASASRSSPLSIITPTTSLSSSSSSSSTTTVRHCSHRRPENMCRADGESAGGSTAVEQARDVLPTNVKPTHYDLTLEPNLETFVFDGDVTIHLDVLEDTKSISLHCLDIKIHETTVTSGETVVASSPNISFNESSQTATITFDKTLPAGSKAKLHHRYTGTLNDNMVGFYRSSYKNAKGEVKYMATTQMEATDCRRAMPCFDEPALKATYTVTLIADKELTCLGNMDVASEREVDSKMSGGKRKAVTFNRTPLMSTYLLAFIVGELKVVESNSFRIPVRVFVTPDQNEEHGRFAAELGSKTLDFYEKEFASPFPLPKMDMVAVPDFSAGAMENWGLVTYRIVDVLLDEKSASANSKLRVAEVVQHELAHQWFGNLVTMDFWDGLWLNEGFATWMSWYSCNKFFPEWKVWENYVATTLQQALSLDGLRSSHPIEVPVKSADQVNQIFDSISYAKGSCVIRMVSQHLGEDVFMEGIRRYLKKHAYGNTRTEDLWLALSDASGEDVVHIADIWTKKMGYPVLTVTEEAGSVHLKQNRFLRTADVKPEEDEVLYPVIVGLRTKNGVDNSLVLEKRETSFKIPEGDFFKLNANHSSIYRTSYTPERLAKLSENAKAGLLTVEDRAGMIADAGALSAAGAQKTSGLLSLLKGFNTESEYVVWNEIISRIGDLRAAWIFEDDKTNTALKDFQRDLVSPQAHKLGWTFSEKDGHIEQQFKALMFASAASAGDEKTKAAAFEMFEKFAAGDRSAIHPNLRAGVFACVLQYGGEKEYDIVQKEYETGATREECNTALRSLGRAEDPALVQRTLAYALSSQVKDQDIFLPLTRLRSHANGITAYWAWLQANWDAVRKKAPPSMSLFGAVVQMATATLATEAQLKSVNDYFADKDTKGFDQSLAQSIDAIRVKIGWIGRDRQDVQSWLASNGY